MISLFKGKSRRLEAEMGRMEIEQRKLQDEMKKAEEELGKIQRKKNEEEKRKNDEESARNKLKKKDNDRKVGLILSNIEQGSLTYTQDLPKLGMVDRLEAHPAGKLLKNAVISGRPPKDREQNLERLRHFKAKNNIDTLTVDELPDIELAGDHLMLSMRDALTDEQYDSMGKYVLISDIFVHYIPMVSFMTVAHTVNFSICDFRATDEAIVRGFPISHTTGENILFTLDYCVAKKDIQEITLAISTSLNTYRAGVQWGAIKVVIQMHHMSFPIKANMQETLGVMHLSDTDLKNYISDPRFSDGVLTPQAFQMLKESYQRGEIEDLTKHVNDKKEVNLARTEVGALDPEADVIDLMRDMKEKALIKQRQQNGAEKNREMAVRLKPALKQTTRPLSPSVVDDEDENDIGPGDSHSVVSEETEQTFKLDQREEGVKGRMRAVNF